jgi:CSLREA domain-containing protein
MKSVSRHVRAWRCLALAATALALAAPAAAASTLSFTVDTTADAPDAHPGDGLCVDAAGACSLRAAVQEANAQPRGSMISVTLPSGVFRLPRGTLSLSRNTVSIAGTGSATTVLRGDSRALVVSVAAGVNLTLTQLELTAGGAGLFKGGGLSNAGTTQLTGVVVTANTAPSGGGITNAAGAKLTLTTSTVSNNTAKSGADSVPGGIAGGIHNSGTLTLNQSAVTGNMAGSGGFGLNDTAGAGGSGGGIYNTGALTLSGSTVSGNSAGSGGPGSNELPGAGGSGGGIYSAGGSLTISNSTVSGNSAGYAGPDEGGEGAANAGNGGGIWSASKLSITGSTISTNTGGTGGTGTSGGGLYTIGSATISQSTLAGNVAGPGYLGASGNGGAIASSGPLTLTNTTVSGNTAGSGAAMSGMAGGNGGGLYTGAGTATLSGDTFAGNASGDGGSAPFVDPGGAFGGPGGEGGAIYASAPLTAANTTITGNSVGIGGLNSAPYIGSAPPGIGGGLAIGAGATGISYATIADNTDGITNIGGTVTLIGTIVADSTGANDRNTTNCTGAIAETVGYNLDSDGSCALSQPTDLSDVEPLLGPLADNGGPTQTLALLSGSPAIDKGGTAATGCPSLDQRGQPRPDEAGDNGACDIGAFESQGLT